MSVKVETTQYERKIDVTRLSRHIVENLNVRRLEPLDIGEVGTDNVVAVDVVRHPRPVNQRRKQAEHFYKK